MLPLIVDSDVRTFVDLIRRKENHSFAGLESGSNLDHRRTLVSNSHRASASSIFIHDKYLPARSKLKHSARWNSKHVSPLPDSRSHFHSEAVAE